MKFSKDYFAEEEREGFPVPEMMKRAWSAELEVLSVIGEACEKLGVRYYVFYGTLLGAVRHGGFIPWDDDIDICMLRDDYDRFMREAPAVLPEGFVISGIYGSCERLWEANKEPQGRVIADETYFTLPRYMNYFHGYPYPRIGVDIFPLDYFYDDVSLQYESIKLCNDIHFVIANWKLFTDNGTLEDRVTDLEKRLEGKTFDRSDPVTMMRDLRMYADRLIASADREKASFVGDVLYCKPADRIEDYMPLRGLRPEWFGEGKRMKFESTEVIVPCEVNKVLEVLFGEDYMTPKMFAAEHEYPFYKTQEKAFDKLLKESGIEDDAVTFCRKWHEMNGGE